MANLKFENVCIDSYATEIPEDVVKTDDVEQELKPVYEKLGIPFGSLRRMSGIQERRLWNAATCPSEGAIKVVKKLLEKTNIPLEDIGALISCSVTRDYFEPAISCVVAHEIKLSETAWVMDISNACIGFSDGMLMLANLIEQGIVKAGIVVSSENMRPILDNCNKIMHEGKLEREEMLKMFPVYTLGCGAAAILLTHKSIAKYKGRRIVASAVHSATQHSELCKGNGDYCTLMGHQFLTPVMYTDSSLIPCAAQLGGRTWPDLSKTCGWKKEDVDHVICHQVGKQVNKAFYETMGLDYEKEFTTYQRYGNTVSTAMPIAFFTAIEELPIKEGAKIVLTAFGSGLNARFTAVEW